MGNQAQGCSYLNLGRNKMDFLKDNLLYILKKVRGNQNTLISSGWPECLWTPSIDLIEDTIEALDKKLAEHADIIVALQTRIQKLESFCVFIDKEGEYRELPQWIINKCRKTLED
jgi:hypothetical protein